MSTAGLVHRGINYDTESEVWTSEWVKRDMVAISRDLHCTSVLLLGSDALRLTEAATYACEEGLYVWFEARQFDQSSEHTLAFLDQVARSAEDLRLRHGSVGISVGCELTLFLPGLVPGEDWRDRGANITAPVSIGYNKRLNDFLAQALRTVRPQFGGPVTYSSGDWESVDWQGFDVVGVDFYRDSKNAAGYLDQLRAYRRYGKSIMITEFGCCAYRGAEHRGGEGFMDVIDESSDPPRVKPGFIRDEGVQADYIDELLEVYESEGLHGAFVYSFSSPETPHTRDPRYDQDLASHCIVKCGPDYPVTGRWEPKRAFEVIANHYRRLAMLE